MYSFIETKLFSRLLGEYLTDDEYADLQVALADAPNSGAAVRRCGGAGIGRCPQASLVTARPGETRWYSRYLLREDPRRDYLDADDLRKERGAEHSRPCSSQDQGGN